jgi:hypothetical protein
VSIGDLQARVATVVFVCFFIFLQRVRGSRDGGTCLFIYLFHFMYFFHFFIIILIYRGSAVVAMVIFVCLFIYFFCFFISFIYFLVLFFFTAGSR